MSDYTPVYGRAKTVSFTAGTAITAGQVLVFSDTDTVSPAAANPANYAGVAGHDAASGAPVTVYMGAGVIHETPVTKGVTAAALVYAGAGAMVTGTSGSAYGGVAVGVAVRTAADGASLRWKTLVG